MKAETTLEFYVINCPFVNDEDKLAFLDGYRDKWLLDENIEIVSEYEVANDLGKHFAKDVNPIDLLTNCIKPITNFSCWRNHYKDTHMYFCIFPSDYRPYHIQKAEELLNRIKKGFEMEAKQNSKRPSKTTIVVQWTAAAIALGTIIFLIAKAVWDKC